MDKITDITIAIWLCLMLFHVARIILIQLKNKNGLWGRPSIKPWLFYTGKLALWTQWIIALMQVFRIAPLTFFLPQFINYLIIPLVIMSGIMLHFSHLEMSEALRPGLSEKPKDLKTKNIYSLTRNPMHLGAYLFGLACILYSFSFYNVILFIYMVYTHHEMVLAEEKHLKDCFKEKWQAYVLKTPRYL